MQYLCKGERIAIRKLEDCPADFELLAKWLSDPAVLTYYEGQDNAFDRAKVEKKFGPRARGEEPVTSCIVEAGEQAIGYCQFYRIDPEGYNTRGRIAFSPFTAPHGIDLFIGETGKWNKGFGSLIVQELLTYLFNTEHADVVFIDPQTWNTRAIRCYEKCGFLPIAIIERRELHNGEYKDSMILRITAEEHAALSNN